MLWLRHIRAGTLKFPKKLTLNPTLMAKNAPFLLSDIRHSLQIFALGMPLHAHANVFSFTDNAVVLSHFRCVHSENQTNIFWFEHFYESKQTSLTQDLEVIGKQRSALQVEFITSVKLICYFVLYYCFLHWAHPPNMAVSDLDFHYTLYLWKCTACIIKLFSFSCGAGNYKFSPGKPVGR